MIKNLMVWTCKEKGKTCKVISLFHKYSVKYSLRPQRVAVEAIHRGVARAVVEAAHRGATRVAAEAACGVAAKGLLGTALAIPLWIASTATLCGLSEYFSCPSGSPSILLPCHTLTASLWTAPPTVVPLWTASTATHCGFREYFSCPSGSHSILLTCHTLTAPLWIAPPTEAQSGPPPVGGPLPFTASLGGPLPYSSLSPPLKLSISCPAQHLGYHALTLSKQAFILTAVLTLTLLTFLPCVWPHQATPVVYAFGMVLDQKPRP